MEPKVVLITGAKGGLGSTVTEAFLASGALVTGVSRSISRSDFPHANFQAIAAELTTSEQAQSIVDAVVRERGRIDALVHLIGGFAFAPLAETTDALWTQMFDLNVRSAANIAKAALPHLEKRSGSIVAISSRAAEHTGAGIAAYAATKAALVSLIRTIAAEYKPRGVTANVILPGTIDTAANRASMPSVDPAKWVQPANLASLILWLTSDAAAQISGAAIPMYGNDL